MLIADLTADPEEACREVSTLISDAEYVKMEDADADTIKTMIGFFKGVLAHGNPIQALFDTRKRLYDFYVKESTLGIVTVLNKAFPFRVYEFVDALMSRSITGMMPPT